MTLLNTLSWFCIVGLMLVLAWNVTVWPRGWLFDRIADRLVARARRTPYSHLSGYMLRWWLAPYRNTHGGEGCYSVRFRDRPFVWLLQQFDMSARVHEILRSDMDDHLHDHPWAYLTMVLRGGYLEVTQPEVGVTRTQWYGPGSILFRRAGHYHKLILPTGQTATTLFITFKYRQRWGFKVGKQKIPYRDYFKGVRSYD